MNLASVVKDLLSAKAETEFNRFYTRMEIEVHRRFRRLLRKAILISLQLVCYILAAVLLLAAVILFLLRYFTGEIVFLGIAVVFLVLGILISFQRRRMSSLEILNNH